MKLEDFEIGKTYTTTETPTIRYKCFARTPLLGNPIFEHMNGNYSGRVFPLTPEVGGLNTWKEYHEPVVHKRKLFWLKDTDGKVTTVQVDPNDHVTLKYWRKSHTNYTVLSEEEISYTEE